MCLCGKKKWRSEVWMSSPGGWSARMDSDPAGPKCLNRVSYERPHKHAQDLQRGPPPHYSCILEPCNAHVYLCVGISCTKEAKLHLASALPRVVLVSWRINNVQIALNTCLELFPSAWTRRTNVTKTTASTGAKILIPWPVFVSLRGRKNRKTFVRNRILRFHLYHDFGSCFRKCGLEVN